MSQYQNLIALQSGLRSASGSEQRQQDGGNRALANMPIYLEQEDSTPVLSSFLSTGNSKPRNFSSDLLQQALAAKSNLGLCDGLTRSDALQSLRSYGSSQGSPSKMGQRLSSVPNPGYPHPAIFSHNTQVESRQEHQGEHYNQGQGKQFAQSGHFVANDHPIHLDLYGREDSQQKQIQMKDHVLEANEESFATFKAPPHLNTIEDEDEFLYGDSTPIPEVSGKAPRPLEPAVRNKGAGNWSDEEVMIVEDYSGGKLHQAVYESPRPTHSKETTSIPLKDLSWKSTTAWKDETVYSRNAKKSRALDVLETTYRSTNRPESSEAKIASPAMESLGLYAPVQQTEQLPPQDNKSKYANAAVLLKKQLDVNNLIKSNSPLTSTSQVDGQKVTDKSLKSTSAAGSPYAHLLINVDQGSNLSKKRVVSLTGRDNSSSKDNKNRNISPLAVQHDKNTNSEPEETSVRVVRDVSKSNRYQEASKVLPSRRLEDGTKQKLDSYNRELYNTKYAHHDRSPGGSPWRISPSSYRHRSPSPDYKSRGRSRSPGQRSRHRSRSRGPEEWRREKSPRQRFRSRGRTPVHGYEDRPRRDKSTDRRMTSKRQHSPEDFARLVDKRPMLAKKLLEGQRPVPPSVEASLSIETSEECGLFPKSMSSEMAALFMRESHSPTIQSVSKAPKELKPAERSSDPVLRSADQDIVMQKLNFVLKQVHQSDMLNELVAVMQEEEEANKVRILAQKVELALDANERIFETQAAAAYPQANTFPQLSPAIHYSSLYQPPATHPASPLNVPAVSYAYGMQQSYPASASASYPVSSCPSPYAYNLPMYNTQTPPQMMNNTPVPTPQPTSSKLAHTVKGTPSRWLRTVPVLSSEEISKSKESEEEVMAQYCEHAAKRALCLKQIENLSNKTVDLKKQREEFQNKSKKVRSGNDNQSISNFQCLQEKVQTSLMRHISDAKRLQEEMKVLRQKISKDNLPKCEEKFFKAKEEKETSEVFFCFDTGKHWCMLCSTRFPSILELVQHLHTPEHLQREGSCANAATKEPPPRVETKNTNLQPVKGLEFVKPLNAFYCSLCEEALLNPKFAEQHLKGHNHTVKYMKYLQENPIYEEHRELTISTCITTLAKDKRLKELAEVSKAQQIILKKKPVEQLQKVQGRLQEEQQLQDPVQDLDEGAGSRASHPPNKGRGIKVTLVEKDKSKEPSSENKKPKQQVIYIGRAPNFRPKVKETKTDKNSAKVGSWAAAANEVVGTSSKAPVQKPLKSPNANPKEVESPSNRNVVSNVDKRSTQGCSRRENAPFDKRKDLTSPKPKASGCQSEAECKTLQRKEPHTVQLQMNEPKTDNPEVNQALKNILYGSKVNLPGKDTKLSAIKLPESPPLPPRSDKIVVKPKPKLQQQKLLTEEEQDFLLLGINKSDMVPIATPRPPPSSLWTVHASSLSKATSENYRSCNVNVPSSLNVLLPDVTVPPPNLNVSTTKMQLPNLNIPPPTLQVPPPNLQVPPPSMHIPNLQVPPPNMLLNKAPVMRIPFGQMYNTPPRVPGANCPRPQVNYNSDVVDMELDFESGTGPEIQVGTPRSHSASGNTVFGVPCQKGPIIERRSGSAIKCKPSLISPEKNKAEMLQISIPDRDDSKVVVIEQNTRVSSLKSSTDSAAGSNEDRLICTVVLNSVIKTVVEKHLNVSSKDMNTSDTRTSNVSESNMIDIFTGFKSTKVVSSEFDATSIFDLTDSTTVEELQKLTNNSNNTVSTEEIAESEDIVSCLNAKYIEASDFKRKVLNSDTTGEVTIQNNKLDSNSTGVNINNKNNNTLESEMHEESLLHNAENIIICDRKDIHIISNQEDLTSLAQLPGVPGTDKLETPIVKETCEVGTSEFDINNKEHTTLESKKYNTLNLKTTNNNITEENHHLIAESQDNPVIVEENLLSLDNVPKTHDDIAIIKNKWEQKNSEINLINDEDTSESPLIHSIEHFMDSNRVEELHEAFSSADESVKDPCFIQETRLQDKKDEMLSICIAEKNLPNRHMEITESSSLELCVSGIESMDVEQTGIPPISIIEADSKIPFIAAKDTQTLETEINSLAIRVSDFRSIDVKKKDTWIEVTEEDELEAVEITGSSSLELRVSGIECMNVEQNYTSPISTVEADSRTPNIARLEREFNSPDTHISDFVSEDVEKRETSLAIAEELDLETASADLISNPLSLNSENNSQDSCILGTRSFDVKLQNSSDLGSNRSEESTGNGLESLDANAKLSSTSSEENLKQMDVFETNHKVSELVLEDSLKTNQCPTNIESSLNEIAFENVIGKENAFILSSSEVRPLDEECSAQKPQSKEEVDNLDEETVHKQKNVETEFLKKDAPENIQKVSNQETTEHPINTEIIPHEGIGTLNPPVVIDICSSDPPHSVLSPGIEATRQDSKTTDESKRETTSETFALGISEDSRGYSGVNSSVPCLDKFDLDDSRSNSTLDDPPVLSEISINKEEPTSENTCQPTTEKKADSDTDEYETEDGGE